MTTTVSVTDPTDDLRRVWLGTAVGDITPPPGTDLSGFIARTAPMTGVHDPLEARAMVFAGDGELEGAAALLTLDVIDLQAPQVAGIRAGVTTMTGIPGERVGISCTHTHGGPATMPDGRLGRCDPAYLDRLCRVAAETVAAAARRAELVVLGWAEGHEDTVGRNRRVPGGVTDPAVPTLRAQRADGTVAALLVGYGCHPVTLGPDNLLATADYPGVVRRVLSSVYPGAAVQFVTCPCGQVNTGHTARDGVTGRASAYRTYAEAERIGRVVAGAALQAIEGAARDAVSLAGTWEVVAPATVRVASRTVRLPFLPLPDEDELARLEIGWRGELAALGDQQTPPGHRERLEVFLAWADKVRRGPAPVEDEAEVMVVAVGDVILVLLPGEAFAEFGLAVREAHPGRRVIPIAYANGRPGYVPHRSAYPAGGYEVDEAFRYYGDPTCLAPEAGEAIVEAAIALVAEVADVTRDDASAGSGRSRVGMGGSA
ncbi:MAG TPA: hypothetical protein VGT61_09260 [Thermomicrobiales bacterium]|jgi:hypothetical protein|nr:hypothetical protein [Thermomicrobiales bacterium]